MRIAVLFDEVHPTDGPRFHANHPRVDEQESPKLLRYLRTGEPLLLTTGRLEDVFDRARGKVVPMSFRTDGAWVWSDATAYYLETHGLQPDPALVKHIRALGHVPTAGRRRGPAPRDGGPAPPPLGQLVERLPAM